MNVREFTNRTVKNKYMQDDKKRIILNAVAKATKKLRGTKSQYLLGAEYDISTSLLSTLERGLKDPQLTTLFNLAYAFNISVSEFMQKIESELPKNFTLDD